MGLNPLQQIQQFAPSYTVINRADWKTVENKIENIIEAAGGIKKVTKNSARESDGTTYFNELNLTLNNGQLLTISNSRTHRAQSPGYTPGLHYTHWDKHERTIEKAYSNESAGKWANGEISDGDLTESPDKECLIYVKKGRKSPTTKDICIEPIARLPYITDFLKEFIIGD